MRDDSCVTAEDRKSTTKNRITTRVTAAGETRYDVRVRIDGKPTTKTFIRRKDADAWLRQILVDDLSGVAVDPKEGKITLAEYADAWIAGGGTKAHLAPKTASYYRDLNRLHVGRDFAGVRNLHQMTIGSIRPEHVRAWFKALSDDRPAIAPKAYRFLSAVLATAARDRKIGANPCQIKGAGAEKSAKRPLISLVDAHDLADAIDQRYRVMVLLAEFGQLRLGELLGLQVRDVDQANRLVRIERQAIEVAGHGRIVTPPKTEAGIRDVHLPDGLILEAVNHIDLFCSQGPDGWLFCAPTGRPWWRWEWAEAWAAAKKKVDEDRAMAGEPLLPTGLHMHDLRHSGLTYVAHTGVTTKELMARGGHASPTAALRYQHAAVDRDREIADKLGVMFEAPRNRPAKVSRIRAARSARDGCRRIGAWRGGVSVLTRGNAWSG